MMKNKETINWDLAAKILSGEALDNEKKEFNLWLSDTTNQKEWQNINQKLEHIDLALVSETIDLEIAWKNVKKRTVKKTRNIYINKYSYIAIAATIIMAFVLFFNQQHNAIPENNLQITQTHNTIKQLQLNDGSIIDINRNSSIQFPEKFSPNTRIVSLHGEAFFEITPDQKRPFIIEAQEIKIKVIGTSFNVKAYPKSECIEVTVKTGVVEVLSLSDTNNKTTLHSGDKVIYNTNDNSLEKFNNNNLNYLAWKTKEISFKNNKLLDAIRLIEEVYNVSITIPKDFDMELAMITATFDKNSVDFIIDVINKTHSTQLTYQHN